ncbi:hypothetical protein N8K70_03315 [Microbacterium betulae]|uniref:Uncharacterized protein n=1 Tax=Microbacterium betulae TaxID=2981139 RepID=A0AA97FK11_9MICO|nr:hypothetical protein [Microbacterium sp. AB]WOF23720.1 hypothetical protein N8K70_03315 [Microbacterium sp. AB]
MRRGRGLASGVVLAAAAAALGAAPAAADEGSTTETVESEHIRIVSTADWDAMGGLASGGWEVWDLVISADAPEPGYLDIGVSGSGELPLVVDVSSCEVAWSGDDCARGRRDLHAGWSVPLDGGTTWIDRTAHDHTTYLRLRVTVDESAASSAQAEVRVHVRGEGDEEVSVPGEEEQDVLIGTGASFDPWPFAAALIAGAGVAGIARLLRRGRERTSG